MKYQIVPAIIPQSLRDLRAQITQVLNAPEVQIDVVDGQFVPFTSWPYQEAASPLDLQPPITTPAMEIDLMVTDPLTAARDWLAVGATRLVFHIETLAAAEYEKIWALQKEWSFQIGLAANNDTPLTVLLEHIAAVNYVQVMGIKEIGTQGQPFDERVLERIAQLRQEYPKLPISVDGSVNKATLPRLKSAGANRFVVGSAILKTDTPAQAYDELRQLVID